MAFHAQGIMHMVNDDGVAYDYAVETFGPHMILRDDTTQFDYYLDGCFDVTSIQKKIDELTSDLQKQKDLLLAFTSAGDGHDHLV